LFHLLGDISDGDLSGHHGAKWAAVPAQRVVTRSYHRKESYVKRAAAVGKASVANSNSVKRARNVLKAAKAHLKQVKLELKRARATVKDAKRARKRTEKAVIGRLAAAVRRKANSKVKTTPPLERSKADVTAAEPLPATVAARVEANDAPLPPRRRRSRRTPSVTADEPRQEAETVPPAQQPGAADAVVKTEA
jgi:hypothetical protein